MSLRDAAARLRGDGPPPGNVTRRQARITAVLPGPPPRLQLDAFGTAAVAYLDSLATPAVGQTVWVLVADDDPLVIGRQA